jgi:hypothetical protein
MASLSLQNVPRQPPSSIFIIHVNLIFCVTCAVEKAYVSELRIRAVPWLGRLVAGLSPRKPGSLHVGFVVYKVALGQDFLRVVRFFPCQHYSTMAFHTHHLAMNNSPVNGRSSEIVSPHQHEQDAGSHITFINE